VFNLEVEGYKEGCLTSLPSVQYLEAYEAFEIVVICKHPNRMRRTFEVVLLMLEGAYDC
jgi:hypothetical protein